tara:strand:- start:160 stop:822 length:663 start_codon:yes stop_codon:yes gene_type:complete
MSLFDESKKERNPFGERTKESSKSEAVPQINQTSLFLRVLSSVFDEQALLIDQSKNCDGFRTRLCDSSWPLHNLQGNVTEPTWANMINATISGMKKTISNSQPNGDWKILDYETKIDHDSSAIERLFLVVKFVDIENNNDLQYSNGAPVGATVNVQNSPIPPELIEALTNRPNDDSRLAGLLEQLVEAISEKTTESKPSKQDPVVSKDLDPDPEPVVFSD